METEYEESRRYFYLFLISPFDKWKLQPDDPIIPTGKELILAKIELYVEAKTLFSTDIPLKSIVLLIGRRQH